MRKPFEPRVVPVGRPLHGKALSPQESQVLVTLIGDGEPTVATVAIRLGISEETTKSYLKRIREKLGPGHGTQTALLKYAIRAGLVPCPCDIAHPAPAPVVDEPVAS